MTSTIFNRFGGTQVDDILLGTDSDDLILPGDGDDTVDAGDGNDTIYAGLGDDWIDAGTGNDHINGGDGLDTVVLQGIRSDYEIINTVVNGILKGEVRHLDSTGQVIEIDTLINIEAVRFLGDGTTMSIDPDAVPVVPETPDSNTGTDFDDKIVSGDGDDTISAGAGNDSIYAGLGDDLIDAGTGNDLINGGAGYDTVVLQGTSADYEIINTWVNGSLVGQIRHLDSTGEVIETDTLRNVEAVRFLGDGTTMSIDPDAVPVVPETPDSNTGTDFDDTIVGSTGDDTISAGAGNDSIYAGLGNDLIDAGTGNDLINGGAGYDTVVLQGTSADYEIVNTLVNGGLVGQIRHLDSTGQVIEIDTLRNIEAVRFLGDATTISTDPSAVPPAAPLAPEMVFVISTGQSLSVGSTDLENKMVLTDSYVDETHALSLGFSDERVMARGWGTADAQLDTFTGFTPLMEYNSETHASGMIQQVLAGYAADGIEAPVFLHIHTGSGGRPLALISTRSRYG